MGFTRSAWLCVVHIVYRVYTLYVHIPYTYGGACVGRSGYVRGSWDASMVVECTNMKKYTNRSIPIGRIFVGFGVHA